MLFAGRMYGMKTSTIAVCECGHSELRHEIPIVTCDGKVSEMRCNLCACPDYVPIKTIMATEVN